VSACRCGRSRGLRCAPACGPRTYCGARQKRRAPRHRWVSFLLEPSRAPVVLKLRGQAPPRRPSWGEEAAFQVGPKRARSDARASGADRCARGHRPSVPAQSAAQIGGGVRLRGARKGFGPTQDRILWAPPPNAPIAESSKTMIALAFESQDAQEPGLGRHPCRDASAASEARQGTAALPPAWRVLTRRPLWEVLFGVLWASRDRGPALPKSLCGLRPDWGPGVLWGGGRNRRS